MIYDVTRPLDLGMAVFPGDLPFSRETTHVVEKNGYRLTNFRMSAHCGTHMDSPSHFVAGGATIEKAPLDLLMGMALVLTVETGDELMNVPQGTERLFIARGFSGADARDGGNASKKERAASRDDGDERGRSRSRGGCPRAAPLRRLLDR